MSPKHEFAILGAVKTTSSWDGSPVTISPPDGVSMPQTTNGSMVLAYQNVATMNNAGTLALTSGGSAPSFLPVPALLVQPTIYVHNWGANNLNITNISPAAATPIWLEAFGPGLPGQKPVALPIGSAVPLKPTAVAQGTTNPNYMQLVMTSNTANLTIVAVIGGPADASGNNAYVIALNSPSGNTGPGGSPAPQGYYATAGGNNYSLEFNWGSSVIYVANMSPSTAAPVNVTLRSL
ncbi:MAG: hypothetical protein ACK4UO_08410 [Pseudolabrys sp.]